MFLTTALKFSRETKKVLGANGDCLHTMVMQMKDKIEDYMW